MSSSSSSTQTSKVKILLVPADEKKPLQEVVVEMPEGKEVEAVLERCKDHFRAIGKTDVETARASVLEQLGDKIAHVKGKDMEDLIARIDMMTQTQMVECHALMNNKKSTSFMSVTMYIDDQGISKGLPINTRATQLTFRVNRPTQVRGDVFLGRYFDNEDEFKRFDFTEHDFNDGHWIGLALSTNPTSDQSAQNMAEMKAINDAAKAQVVEVREGGCARAACPNDGSKRCARCRKISYCGVECQKVDWKRHKKSCTKA